jgi:uracil-DNA glycosylase family 4
MPLLPKPAECTGCALYGNGMGFSRPEGTGSLGVACFAEALGEDEERDGLPLRPYAQAGSMFQRILKMCGYDRAMFTLYNVVNCRPPRNWLEGASYEAAAIAHCRVHRERVIDAVKPRVIIALGGVALRTLTGEAGEKRGISYLRGYILPALKGYRAADVPCPDCNGSAKPGCFLCEGSGVMKTDVPTYSDIYVMPTFHPSFIQRGEKRMIGVVAHDIKKAVDLSQQLLHGRKPERKPITYQTRPSLDEATAFMLRCQESQGALLTYDIETPSSAAEDEDLREIGSSDDDEEPAKPRKYPQDYALSNEEGTIIQVQFSLGPCTGIAFPWRDPYIQISRAILAMNHRKAGWNNSTFDDPRLKANGCVINGIVEDFMWKWHHLQPDLPAGLQFACSFLGMDFPWKHLYGEDLGHYGCADVDAPQRADQPLTDALQKLGISRGYERHIVALTPPLQAAADRGVPVNREKLSAFDKKIAAAQEEVRVTKIMPKVVGLGLGKIEPKEGLKTTNTPELKKLLQTMTEDEAQRVRLCHIDAKGKEWFYHFEKREFFDKKAATVDIYQISLPTPDDPEPAVGMVIRWCRHFEFNPGSADQLKEYMKAKKHPIPKDFKTDAETTNKVELVRLANKVKDSFYTDVIEFREFQKMRSTYCKGWIPAADGCVHTTWTFRPATGQLSSVSPNIQNAPKHAELAKEFRDCIEAPAGYKIVEFDYKSFHVLTLGFEARDADYMRAARLDMHSLIAGHFLKLHDARRMLEKSDDELREYFTWFKSDKQRKFVRDKKAKTAILGVGFGEQAHGLFMRNREFFNSIKESQQFLDLLDFVFPKPAHWRLELLHQAQRDYRLVTRHGYHRRFYDILVYWGMGRIEDAVRRGRKVPALCSFCKQRHERGEEAEKAIALQPANDAFGTIKDAMLDLDSRGWLERAGFCNQIHDSLKFVMHESVMDEAIPAIYAGMTKPSIILTDPEVAPNGLVCDVEVGVGQTWRNLEPVSISTGMSQEVAR